MLLPRYFGDQLRTQRWLDLEVDPCSSSFFAPLGAVPNPPIYLSEFEPDIVSNFLRFNPFVLQNLFALRLKLPVKRGILQQIVC